MKISQWSTDYTAGQFSCTNAFPYKNRNLLETYSKPKDQRLRCISVCLQMFMRWVRRRWVLPWCRRIPSFFSSSFSQPPPVPSEAFCSASETCSIRILRGSDPTCSGPRRKSENIGTFWKKRRREESFKSNYLRLEREAGIGYAGNNRACTEELVDEESNQCLSLDESVVKCSPGMNEQPCHAIRDPIDVVFQLGLINLDVVNITEKCV